MHSCHKCLTLLWFSQTALFVIAWLSGVLIYVKIIEWVIILPIVPPIATQGCCCIALVASWLKRNQKHDVQLAVRLAAAIAPA